MKAIHLISVFSLLIFCAHIKQENNNNEPIKNTNEFLLFETEPIQKNGVKHQVKINGYYEKPKNIESENIILLEGLSKGEFIEIIIEGKIFNFQHVEVGFDMNEFTQKKIIHEYDSLSDKTIIIETYMPEGIPYERLQWDDVNGNKIAYLIAEQNMAD